MFCFLLDNISLSYIAWLWLSIALYHIIWYLLLILCDVNFCSFLLYCDIIWTDIQTHIYVEERFSSTGVSCIILRQHFISRPGAMVIRSNKLWTDLQCISPQHRPKGTSTIYPWSVEVQETTLLLGGFPCQPSCSNVFWVSRSLSSECWRLIE